MDSFARRHGSLILTISAWLIVGSYFVVLFVRDPSRWAWAISLLMLFPVVSLVGAVRYLGMDPSSVSKKWSILALGVLFPPAEKYLDEVERRGAIITENKSLVANMVQTLNAYGFCGLAGQLQKRCKAWTISKAFEPPDKLTVETCAALVAQLKAVKSAFNGHSPRTVGHVWSLLYWDRYEPGHEQLVNRWQAPPSVGGGDVEEHCDLASPLALALLRRNEIEGFAVRPEVLEEYLDDFLSTPRPFRLEEVLEFAADEAAQRSASEARIANMRHTLHVYDLGGISATLEAKLLGSRGARQALTVEECAEGVVRGVSKIRTVFPNVEALALQQMLSLLYWDRYEPANPEFLHIWQKTKTVLAPLVARAVFLRPDMASTDVDVVVELGDHLLTQKRFSMDVVLNYLRTRPTHVAARMQDILDSYAPRPGSSASAPWPTMPSNLVAHLANKPVGARVKIAAGCCALTVSGPPVPLAELLEFLYRRRFDRPTAIAYWDKRPDRLIPELARVLAQGTRVPESTGAFSHVPKRLERILSPMHEYSLTLVKRELFDLQELVDRCKFFSDYLVDEHDIQHELAPDPDEIMDCVDQVSGGFPADEHELGRLTKAPLSNEVLIRFAGNAIAGLPQQLGPEVVNPLALVAVGEFVEEKHAGPAGALDDLARRAAQTPIPSRLLFGLMMLRRDSRGATLSDVLDQVETLLVEHDEDAAVLRRIRWDMLRGRWPTALPDVSDATDPTTTIAGDTGPEKIEQAVEFASVLGPELELIEEDLAKLRAQVEAVARFEHDRLEPELQQLEIDIPALRERIIGIGDFERDELEPELRRLEKELGLLPTRTEATRLRDLLLSLARPSDLGRYYLITFDSRTGPIASLLDALTKLTSKAEALLRRLTEESESDTERADEVITRIKSDYYRFGNYTKYARVGLLPENQDSDQFTDNLFADLRWLLCITEGQCAFPQGASKNIDWQGVEVTFLNLGLPIMRELRPVGALVKVCTKGPLPKKVFRTPSSIDRIELQQRLGDVDPLRSEATDDRLPGSDSQGDRSTARVKHPTIVPSRWSG